MDEGNGDDLTGLRLSIEGGVARITIDHPPMNLVDWPLLDALGRAVERVADDDDVRVVVVDSADPDFWIAHFDVALILRFPSVPDEPPAELNPFVAVAERFRTMPKLTVAQIGGIVRGGGAELAASFDVRVVAHDACIGQPEVALGILPGGSGTQRLAELVGRSRALEIVLGCGDIDGEEAARIGWANRSVPGDRLASTVDELARRVASFPGAAIAEAKAAVLDGLPDPVPGLLAESRRFNRLAQRPEAVRRMTWFLANGGQTREGERDLAQLLGRMADADTDTTDDA